MDSSTTNLRQLSLSNAKFNLLHPELTEEAIRNAEGQITAQGAFIATTGPNYGRAAKDKFIVEDELTKDTIHWGSVNQPITAEKFIKLRERMFKYLEEKQESGKNIYVLDSIAGADRKNSVNIRVITEYAWHSKFMRNMLEAINSESAELAGIDSELYEHEFTIIDAPNFYANPRVDGTRSETFILVNLSSKEVLIGGTAYAGEMKKSAFSILNYLYPERNIMPMHCSANASKEGDNVAIFFGLSGTGKTTLSADPGRVLIGDDEHGWSSEGVFNFESGCYAKTIGLTEETEPEIFHASRTFGATVENVVMNDNRSLDYDDTSLTENGRVSYPLNFIPNALVGKDGDRFIPEQPKNIVMLTCDAFGVLPAVSKLSPEQAKEQFLLGYTAKVAGTEAEVKEPTATFSACFGAPFMPRNPQVYGDLLATKIAENEVNCWLVNTGWAGGAYGVGKRMSLKLTRAIISKIHSGDLAREAVRRHETFGLDVPSSVALPQESWASQDEYNATAEKLKAMFAEQKAKLGL